MLVGAFSSMPVLRASSSERVWWARGGSVGGSAAGGVEASQIGVGGEPSDDGVRMPPTARRPG